MEQGNLTIGVMGAGSIGCYLGGKLLAAGTPTVLVGRPALAAEVAQHGMRLTDYLGGDQHLTPQQIQVHTSTDALAPCDMILLTVKGGDTAGAAALLAPVLKPGAIVVSFQNGVTNPDILRTALPGHRVIAGMVPFNVLRRADAHFHRGTSGSLAVESTGEQAGGAQVLIEALRRAGLPVRPSADIVAVLWGKLVINLNNSVNALAGLPLKEMLAQRAYRRVTAACIREGLRVLAAAGIRPVFEMPLPPSWFPTILSLPDVLFALLARPLIRIDPQARSSMWDDLNRGRVTEIDLLNGEIVRLAARVKQPATVNAAILKLVKEAEGHGSPGLSAAELCSRLGLG